MNIRSLILIILSLTLFAIMAADWRSDVKAGSYNGESHGGNVTAGSLPWCAWGAADGDDNDQPDGQIAAATVAMIEKLGDTPWFIGCGFMKSHDSLIASNSRTTTPRKSIKFPGNMLMLSRNLPLKH